MNKGYEMFRAKSLYRVLEPSVMKVACYLDFGCGDAIFTRVFADNLQKKNGNVTVYAFDICDMRHEEIKKIQSISFIKDLSELGKERVDVCTVVDVVHHVKNDIYETLQTVLYYIKSEGKVIIKDYILSISEPFKSLQKLSLTLKDKFANPEEMVKGFNYLNIHQWDKLFKDLDLTVISSFPFYYLPGEKFYSLMTGQAWIWILQKNRH